MIIGFSHTSFTVADMDSAIHFWTGDLGFELGTLVERKGAWQEGVTGINGARLRIAHVYDFGNHIEFIQYLNATGAAPELQPNMAGIAHVCLEVDDIHETSQFLLQQGAMLQGRMVSSY